MLKVGEKEQFVLDNRPTERAAEAVVVEPRIAGKTLLHPGLVHRIKVTVPEVLVEGPVDSIGAALYGGAELSARRVAEVRIELILNQRKVLHGFWWNRDEGAGNSLVVVIHSLDHEVVVTRPLSPDGWTHAKAHRVCVCDTGIQHR